MISIAFSVARWLVGGPFMLANGAILAGAVFVASTLGYINGRWIDGPADCAAAGARVAAKVRTADDAAAFELDDFNRAAIAIDVAAETANEAANVTLSRAEAHDRNLCFSDGWMRALGSLK